MSCKCQQCGKQYKVDLLISDVLWNKIRPSGKEEGAGMLCGSCIIDKIEQFDKYGAYHLCRESKQEE